MADIPEQNDNSIHPIQEKIIATEKNGQLVSEAPKNIIQSVSAARALYATYRTSNLPRIGLFASIEGLIAGNPPYDQVELDQLGLSHIANFNNGDASSMYEQGGLVICFSFHVFFHYLCSCLICSVCSFIC